MDGKQTLEERIGEWRKYIRRRSAVHPVDVEELPPADAPGRKGHDLVRQGVAGSCPRPRAKPNGQVVRVHDRADVVPPSSWLVVGPA